MSFLADLYTEDEKNLKKIEPTVGKAAQPEIAALEEEAAGLEKAKRNHDLKAATALLKDAETQKAKLIPNLKDKKLAAKFEKVLEKNKVLNRLLASGKGTFADIDNYMKFKDQTLSGGAK